MATQIRTTKVVDGGSGGSTSVKTTTYETTRSSTIDEPTYRPRMTQRSLVIQRGSVNPVQSSMSIQRSQSYGVHSLPEGAYQAVSALGIGNVKSARDQEKRDMQDLNERFAGYIERVRFLEAQNRKLADELDKLKSKWGKETTAIKAMYQAELDEARRLLDDSEKEKAGYQVRLTSLETEVDELRDRKEALARELAEANEKIQKQNEVLSQYESEINHLQRRLESLENERDKDKKEIARLTEALNRARIDLDNETLAHIDAENRRQTLEEELEFMKQVHDQEMKELAALAYRDTTNENREFWKSEMSQCMRDIQKAYDDKLDTMRSELETYYNCKVQEFRTGAAKNNMETVHAKDEVKRLRGQMTDLRTKLGEAESRIAMLLNELENAKREAEESRRELETERLDSQRIIASKSAELEAILRELQELMDSKLGLELEIAAYRKLLEGEENKVGLKQVVDQWVSGGNIESSSDSNLRVSQVVKGEMSAKTTYQRSAKGPIAIHECNAEGKFITLENTSRREEDLSGWKIVRVVDGNQLADYVLPSTFTIKGGQKIKILAGGQAGFNELAANLPTGSWGLGANITTKLCNPLGEDKATHVQRTVYTS